MNNRDLIPVWRRGKLISAGVLSLAMILNATASFGAGSLNVYNWAEYICDITSNDVANEVAIKLL